MRERASERGRECGGHCEMYADNEEASKKRARFFSHSRAKKWRAAFACFHSGDPGLPEMKKETFMEIQWQNYNLTNSCYTDAGSGIFDN